ncbi:MAG TPA: ATPase, T2SS/T4P/T4SS family, partial [Tepidisphaeraceae bacterium]
MFGRRPTSQSAIADDPADVAEQLWSPASQAMRQSVEQLLLARGQITQQQLVEAVAAQKRSPGKSLVQVLAAMNAATEPQILSALAQTLGLPFETPERATVDAKAYDLLPIEFIRQHGVLPLRFEGDPAKGPVVVAVAEPTNVFLIDDVKRKLRRDVKVVVTTLSDINRIVEQMSAGTSSGAVDDIIKDIADDDITVVKDAAPDDVSDLEKAGSESPVIRFVNYLIFDAIKQGASDIHVEPKEGAMKVRYRIDGVMFEAMNPPHTMHPAVVSRLKIMANLDISERRLPQDGRIRATVSGRKIDLRLSTLPTGNGEKSVIRILDNRSISVPLEALGFSEQVLTIWRKQIDQPHGILLVTGPTGSG